MSNFYHIKSIAQVHEVFGFEKPLHPLVTIVRKWPQVDFDFQNTKLTSDLYLLGMKGKIRGNTFQYGRNSYDFQEGTLVFLAPGQVVSFTDPIEELDDSGWSIVFHPDLIRRAELGQNIKEYSFFNYDVNEALHLSDKEKRFLSDLIEKIDIEINQNLDKHSQNLIVQNIETILKYSNRFYDRQFYTRTNLNRDLIAKFEQFLEGYFSSELLSDKGMPSLSQCGQAMNMSGSYLSDLLKLETGHSAKDHILAFTIDKAKTLLLNSANSVSQVAYSMGFEYPQNFSKLFKSRTGLSPSEYRKGVN